jgi:hypothetical protein
MNGNCRDIHRGLVRKLLTFVYRAIVDRASPLPDAFEERSVEDILHNVPVLEIETIYKDESDYISDRDVIKIESFNIDVFIQVGFRILRGKILESSKYGIWSYHHGDNGANTGDPPGFWEVMESRPATGSMLQMLTGDSDKPKVLYRSYSCTDMLSVKANINNVYWKSVSFVPRKLEELSRIGRERFLKKVEDENRYPEFYSSRLFVKRSNSEYGKLILKKIAQKIKNRFIFQFYFDQWLLMWDLSGDISGSLLRYKKILPPKDRYWADPFIVYKDGKYYMYIEEFPYKSQRGRIALIVMDEEGNYEAPVVVIERPYHLSYPFVFQLEGEFYMVPETCENQTIELYKCVEFPYKWEFQMDLMKNVTAVDTTLFYSGSKWWLFTNMIENRGASAWDELFLFYSDRFPCSDWTSHPLNPIISDSTRARPAGKLFERNGRIYRPSQNCSVRYGYGLHISEITCLNEYEYSEKIVTSIEPKWARNILGVHSFNHEKRLSVIDAQVRRRK